jgi:flagellar L-ring protein precursor FlgH
MGDIMKQILAIPLLIVTLSGCVSTVPATAIHQPMSVRPGSKDAVTPGNGAIFSNASSRPLFEDRRARFVGDTLTINIVEKTQASKKSDTKAERSQSMDVSVPAVIGLPFKGVQGMTLGVESGNKFDGTGENTSSNDFISTITVTVIDVYPNGNLLVSGEKLLGLKEGEEFIRFSGVVNPNTITGANTVQSTQVADARMEFKANGFIDSVGVMGWLSRVFLNVMPF